MNEITQKDIKSKYPLPSGLLKGDMDLKMLTLGNLKSLKEKASKFMRYGLIDNKQDIKIFKEWQKIYILCNDEIKKRIKYINKPIFEGKITKKELRQIIKDIILENKKIKYFDDKLNEVNILPRESRPYKCTVCGKIQSITTNNDGPVLDYCLGCSWAPSKGETYNVPGLHKNCRVFVYDPSVNEGDAVGYSHNSTDDYSDVELTRDPLNDPLLNGKSLHESYKFKDFSWLANMDGFNKPTDVYKGTILLGVIISKSDGYVVDRVISPNGGSVIINQSKSNKFKTKNIAAERLFKTWQQLRNNEL